MDSRIMTVFPMLDKKSGEVILIYRNKRKGEKTGWLDAEVYKFHDDTFKVASHYGAYNINEEYLATLELPTEKDEMLAEAAVSFYQAHLKKCDGTKVVRSHSKTFIEYHEARAKFPLDKTLSEG